MAVKSTIIMKRLTCFLFYLALATTSWSNVTYVNYTSGNDLTGTGTSSAPYKTFHQGYISTASGDTLNLTGTFTWTNSDETGDLANAGYTISKNITIIGQGPGNTMIEAHPSPNTADRRVFTVVGNYIVRFRNLTIRHGRGFTGYVGPTYTQFSGGAIGVTIGNTVNATLDLHNVSIKANYSTTTATGGVLWEGNFLADRCSFENNTAGTSALASAIQLYFYSLQRQRNIINSTFYNNTSTDANVAALYVDRRGANIVNCTFSNNSSGINAYGMFGGSVECAITNCVLANSAGYDLMANSGTANGVKVKNSIVEVEASGGMAISYTSSITGNQPLLNLVTPSSNEGNNNITPYLQVTVGSIAIGAGSSGTTGSSLSGGVVAIPNYDQRGATFTGLPTIGSYATGGILLPLTWLSFSVQEEAGEVLLQWRTEQEHHTKDFIVQYSIDGNTWQNLATIRASGSSNDMSEYEYRHMPALGLHYYRILQRDMDNRQSYSVVKSLRTKGEPNKIQLMGNPVSKGMLQIQYSSASLKKIAVYLYNNDGRLLLRKTMVPGYNTIDVSNYTSGSYWLKTEGWHHHLIILR